MEESHGQEKQALTTDYQKQLESKDQSYKVKLSELWQSKDEEREKVRTEMQKEIDQLNKHIGDEKKKLEAVHK